MPFTPKERERRRDYMRSWRAKNRGVERGYKFKHRYGITIDEYDNLLLAQKGLCAICARPETARWMGTDRIRTLSVDHCHKTGKVRGLLCHSCNRILGLLDDDPDRLRRALNYLEDR